MMLQLLLFTATAAVVLLLVKFLPYTPQDEAMRDEMKDEEEVQVKRYV